MLAEIIRLSKIKTIVMVCLPILILLIIYLQIRTVGINFALNLPYISVRGRSSRTLQLKDTTSFDTIVDSVPQKPLMNNSFNNGVCKGKLLRDCFAADALWQPIDKEKTMYAFSAYYIQTVRKVFIIGAKPMYNVAVICQLWSKQGDECGPTMWETDAKIGTPNDPAGPLPYTATIFECLLNATYFPTHVSLVTQSCQNDYNLLNVNNASEIDTYERHYTACLAPIYSYGSAHEFVEWIELNRILGVEKYVIYNYSTAPAVDRIIGYYAKRGLVEVIQWRLPFPVTHHIHYFGQTAALNDCLFRNKQASEFITNIDLDEYIIPLSKNASNWTQMIEQQDQLADGYIFRNTFFRKEWTNENIEFKEKTKAQKFHLVTLKHFEREKKVYRHFDRSKYFARPSRVHFTLIHEIPHARVVKVPTEIGLLYHYRNWEIYWDKQERVKDITLLEKFGESLINNVEEVWRGLAN